jgi:hydroxyacylglutathione hydrolase
MLPALTALVVLLLFGLAATAGVAAAGPWLTLRLGHRWVPKVIIRPDSAVGPGVTWFDDYFTYEYLDEHTVAIGEPRYFQQNHSYLILGTERAVLFDSGPGLRDMLPVVTALTDLPVTVTASHLHYDHVGHLHRFTDVALLDVPVLREAVRDGLLHPPPALHLGAFERIPAHPVRVTRWLPPGGTLDLGGRRLTVRHLPGHTPDGMALYDDERDQLFAGDLLYPGGAYAVGPGTDVLAYQRSLADVRDTIGERTAVLVAHPGRVEVVSTPVMSRADVVRLHDGFVRILDRTARWRGVYPRLYRLDEEFTVRTDAFFRHGTGKDRSAGPGTAEKRR